MAPLFGGRDGDGDPGRDALIAAELDRVGGLPLPQLAAEVMDRAFGPGGPGGPGQPGTLEAGSPTAAVVRLDELAISRLLVSADVFQHAAPEQLAWLRHVAGEAVQALEHAALIRVSWQGGGQHCVATRRGRSATEQGTADEILAAGAGS
jgi:hypothetical protein